MPVKFQMKTPCRHASLFPVIEDPVLNHDQGIMKQITSVSTYCNSERDQNELAQTCSLLIRTQRVNIAEARDLFITA